jgi:hypothetical protein
MEARMMSAMNGAAALATAYNVVMEARMMSASFSSSGPQTGRHIQLFFRGWARRSVSREEGSLQQQKPFITNWLRLVSRLLQS